ncbi:MAG: type II toxin-antitoxin system VapC family toxin [Candidatus Firestonebacteria bacterium]
MQRKFLLDTDVLINHLRDIDTKTILELSAKGEIFICAITNFEILRGMRKNEEDDTLLLLQTIKSLEITKDVAAIAAKYYNIYFKSHDLELPDIFIAAVAKFNQLTLVTMNKKHFPMKDIGVISPNVS